LVTSEHFLADKTDKNDAYYQLNALGKTLKRHYKNASSSNSHMSFRCSFNDLFEMAGKNIFLFPKIGL
jgi:hypothetical protein